MKLNVNENTPYLIKAQISNRRYHKQRQQAALTIAAIVVFCILLSYLMIKDKPLKTIANLSDNYGLLHEAKNSPTLS